jgi:hypothetical protein
LISQQFEASTKQLFSADSQVQNSNVNPASRLWASPSHAAMSASLMNLGPFFLTSIWLWKSLKAGLPWNLLADHDQNFCSPWNANFVFSRNRSQLSLP